MPFFSVVMPVYNKGPHVARAIRSVLDQTFDDFELILINDASTDNSLEEVIKFVDPRIRILHRQEPGPGGYAARNLGIEKACADWIAFLDADDEWFPDHLGSYRKLIDEFPSAGMLCCGYKIRDNLYFEENSYFKRSQKMGDHIVPTEVFFKNLSEGSFIQFTSCACIRKNILQEIGGFPAGRINKAGDIFTWCMCALKTEGIAWSAHLGAIYNRNSENMVTKTAYPSPDALLNLTEELLETATRKQTYIIKKNT